MHGAPGTRAYAEAREGRASCLGMSRVDEGGGGLALAARSGLAALPSYEGCAAALADLGTAPGANDGTACEFAGALGRGRARSAMITRSCVRLPPGGSTLCLPARPPF